MFCQIQFITILDDESKHGPVCDELGKEITGSVDISLKGELHSVAPRGFPGKGV